MLRNTRTLTKLSYLFVLIFALSFYACQKEELVKQETPTIENTFFQQQLVDNTQLINAADLGNGVYEVIGAQGTTIEIDNALVNAKGERVRGAIQVELIEIYSPVDMILNRKQTLANYDGQNALLESGGELYIQVYQNGEQLSVDGNGTMEIYLPTSNTGGARYDMELYYGDVVGEQVIWQPTGEKIRVVNNSSRNTEEYLIMIQTTLGWVNVDVVSQGGGEFIECIDVEVQCDEICGPVGVRSTVVAMYVPGLNSAFEVTQISTSGFQLCSNGRPINLGGVTVTFIVVVECNDGSMHTAFVTTTLNPGYHQEIIDCSNFTPSDPGQFQQDLQNLIP